MIKGKGVTFLELVVTLMQQRATYILLHYHGVVSWSILSLDFYNWSVGIFSDLLNPVKWFAFGEHDSEVRNAQSAD